MPDAKWVEDTSNSVIRRFVPPMPLPPGTYTIECQDPKAYPGTFEVREGDVPAAPVSPLELTESHRTRGDDGGCCTGLGDVIELRFAGDTRA